MARITFSLLLHLLVLTGCSQSDYSSKTLNEFKILTAEGAKNIYHRSFEGGHTQFDYTVEAIYPSKVITKKHYNKLKTSGWSECVGDEDDWHSYIDMTYKDQPYCIFRHRKHFINEDRMMLISLSYKTYLTNEQKCPSFPDDNTQSVIIVIYKVNNMEEELTRNRLSCN